MKFGEAIEKLKEGKMIARTSWEIGTFIFMQVPSEINKEIVTKMQSLPQSVKDALQRRFDNPKLQISSIFYDNQIAKVNPSNLVTGYSPSISDSLAVNWFITS